MTGPAKIDSVDVLREVKAMLAQFAETANQALVGVDADIARVKQWLNSERPGYWKRRIRELEDAVEAARAEIRRKEIVAGKDPVSVVDERKKLNRAKAKLDDAQRRAEAARRWAATWERESMLYKAACSPLSNTVQADMPRAMARLERMMASLEEYVRLTAPTNEAGSGAAVIVPSPNSGSMLPDYRELRHHVPGPESRGTIDDRALVRLSWTAGQPSDTEQASLIALPGAGAPPNPDETMTIAWRATSEPAVYFIRTSPTHNRDSGWYIGPQDHPGLSGGFRVCRVAEVIEQLPGITSILGLDQGCVLVLTRGVVRAVLDRQDRDIWSSPSEAAL